MAEAEAQEPVPMSEAEAGAPVPVAEAEARAPEWILDIELMLGCLDHPEVKACSISRVPENLRKASKKEAYYSPKIVSVGPFRHGTGSDNELQLMEETKWRYMYALLYRAIIINGEIPPTQEQQAQQKQQATTKLQDCSNDIRRIDPVVRASYGGEIKLKPEELARIMLVDGCFILELLLKLYEHVTQHQLLPQEKVEENMRILSDLTMLENQIPFIVLKKLHENFPQQHLPFPSLNQLAATLFGYCYNANLRFEVFHFLHLMHLSSIYNDVEISPKITEPKKATQELKRCARKLRASGIKIQAGKYTPGNFALNKFVDKFGLNIQFDGDDRALTVPPLHVKEGTEVKWRNLIAWEQSGIDKVGYKFTSYALFFSSLICSVHDIELLRIKNIIIVDDPNIGDEDLLELFTTIANGVKKMDSRYSQLCKRLNAKTIVYRLAILRPRMWWHYWRRVLAWLRKLFRKWILDFRRDYMPNPWVFMGVIAATALLGLTIAQTYFAARGN